jgi:Fic family protein/DNA-binding XRE family transcriptional regulator
MKTLLKSAREQKGLKTREVAQLLGIDQALISKFESGTRKPTREQVLKLAALLEIDLETIMITWLKEKILYEIGPDEFALKALLAAEEEIRYQNKTAKKKVSAVLQKILDEIDSLKTKLDSYSTSDTTRIPKASALEYTFESNRIEGNTMTLRETDLVINEGLTISGKSMREHLEVINHHEAITYIKDLMQKNTSINERELLSIHYLIVRGIHPEDAGRYRKGQVQLQGSNHIPVSPLLLATAMEDFFIWFETNKNSLHPIVLAADAYERLLTIHPFTNGNGRTARLVMNLILLQHGYSIATIKGDNDTKTHYYQALETAQTKNNKEAFLLFIAQTEKESLARYLSTIAQ